MIEIKDISGKTRFSTSINKGAKGKFTLMKEDYIILPFSVSTPIPFKLGDYVDLSGVLDESLGGKLAKIYEITDLQKPTYNSSTGGYDYKLQMNAYYWKWKNKIFKYTPEHAGSEASWSLTASLDVQLGVFLRNLKALGYNYRGTDFTFSIDDTVENKAVAMTYDNMNLLDALFSMAGEDKWNCDCWITDNVIHFGRNEFGDAVKIERGLEASSITRSESQGTYATRIYAFGSTKNIPTNYRPTDEQAVVNGVVQKRLMLPADTPYIDAYEGMSQEEAIEDVVVFDDVYPRRVGTLSDVHTRTEEVENEGGTKETVTYYRYKDTGLEFKEEYIIEGQELKIRFQSGKLNGMEFGVIFNPSPKDETRGEQLWEIVRNDDYGRPLPDDMMYPANGDEYVLSGFDIQLVSDQYIPEAEQELKEKAQKYADKVKKDDGTYPTTLSSSWVKEDLISRTFEFGQRINLVDDTYFENGRISRVLGWEMNLDIPWDSPVYTIGESMPYSRIGEIEDKVDSLTYKGQTYTGGGGSVVYVIKVNDSTAPSDSNVFSALRSKAEFISKKFNDTVIGVLTFLQTSIFRAGAIFGKDGYAEGMTGFGAKIDENGNAEVESLTSRRYIETPEFRFNSIEIFLGDKWRAPGGGLIDTVDTENKICTLKLEDGQIGAVAVGDICMGIFHSLTSSDNATEDTDDSRGNRTFAGFCTVYFTITEVMGDRNEQFKYQIRPVSDSWEFSFDPFEMMNFVAYGSFTREDRQTSVYETRTYTRYLWHQNTWEIGKGNIAKQSGDLSNLNVFGLNMEGYSEYTNSVYFTGNITQVKPDGTPVITANDRGAWINNTQYFYYDRVSHNGCIWLCVNESGTNTEPSESNPNWLLQVSKGENGQDGTSFRILGSKNDESELPQEGNKEGDGYLIQGHLWVWSGTEWNDAGVIQGPAGQSVTNMGGWYEGLHVPYLGVVRMGNATFMCVVEEGTDNPPYYTLLDKDSNRLKTESGYILTGEINNAEYQLIAADGTNGKDGLDGVAGQDGKDGKTFYTWIRYADDAEGNGISNDPTGKAYIGFAYNKQSPLESNNPDDYTWSDIKGEQGVPGKKGEDGIQYYTWIVYSDNADGNPMYQQPTDSTKYIGIAVNKTTEVEGTDPSEYTWSKFRGEDGKDGLNGADGVDGKDGTSIIWKGEFASAPSRPQNGWAYKNTTDKKSYVYQDGSWYQMTIDGVDGKNGENGLSIVWKGDLSEAPANPQMNWAYRDTDNGRVYIYNGNAWELMVVDGTDGTDGADGQNGLSVYITYNDSEAEPSAPTGDGTTNGWHTNATSTTIWMSQKVAASSSEGTWGKPIKVKGETGSQGEKGDGFSVLGHWYEGMIVPYLGVVTMGGNSFAAKVATTNPPMFTLMDSEGNRLKTNDGYILTGEINTAEYDIIAEKGKDGEDGLQGLQGEKGEQGIAGKDGADGKTSYFHIKYSENENGYPMTETPSKYIGTYVDFEEADSEDYTKYAWARFEGIQGEKGEQGIPGYNGTDGKTYYLHIKYSNDGGSTFTGNNGEDSGDYIGVLTDLNPDDSTNPSDYKWSKIKGEQGAQGIQGLQGEKGEQGIQGEKGEDGRTSYFHIKYSANSNGNPMTEVPSTYIGTYVDFTEQDSNDYTKYTWSRFEGAQGEKGEQGIAGINGENGKTSYLHIAYSNSSDGSVDFSVSNSTNKSYIGQYTDFEQNDSTDYRKYSWTKIKGEQGEKGDGYTNLGTWYNGLLVPKMGVVTMAGSSYVAKVATYNPPMFTLMDSEGNRLKTNSGYILTGEMNTAEYDVLAEKGEQGIPGKDGQDGADGKDGKDGQQGIQGVSIIDSEWALGVEYRNDSNITDGSLSVRIVNVALVRNDAIETGWDAYLCLKTHVSSESITYTNTSYWSKFSANFGAVFASFILAKNAKIKFMQGNQLLIQKSDGTVTAGLSGSEEGKKIRIWAGSETPENAPYRVDEDGETWQTNAHVTGEINATSGSFQNVNISGSLRTPWKTLIYEPIYISSGIDIWGFNGSAISDDKIIISSILNNSELLLAWGDNADGRTVYLYVKTSLSIIVKVPSGKFMIMGNVKYAGNSTVTFAGNSIYILQGFADFWIASVYYNNIPS